MADLIKIKQGLNIQMVGKAKEEYGRVSQSALIGFNPDSFYGIVPKPIAKIGDKVKVGTVLFVDKKNPAVKIVSPVSGELLAINRGERRKILDFVIQNDFKFEQEEIKAIDLNGSAEDIKSSLSDAGFLAFFKQRPYDVCITPSDTPKAIFISAFDKAPLAPDFDFILKDEVSNFQAGVNAISKIAPVHIGVEKGCQWASHLQNATVTEFQGDYPASNVGVQINKISPINRGEIVWTITPQEVAMIGRFVNKGKLDFTKTVVFCGECASEPAYYKVLMGSPVSSITKANVYGGINLRYIAGNPLSGAQTSEKEWLNPLVSQLTVIPEGDDTHELIGWIMPRFTKFSLNGSFVSGILSCFRNKFNFSFDARVLGGERHMIMSGEYDKVFPMDIYPEYLIKAIISGNIEKMEELGIYEVAPEDFAAAEFVCSSKMELQSIVRKGLDMLRKEMC